MIRNRYNQVPHLAQDTLLESDKIKRQNHTLKKPGVSPLPAGDPKAATNRQDRMTK